MYELTSYCEHDAVTEVLKMKANTEIPVTLLDSEKKKKKIIYTESFVFILIRKCELHNMPSQELHVPRKNS